MPIQWTQDLAVGVEEIDAQHRELYANVASLHEAMRAHRLASDGARQAVAGRRP